MIESGQDIDPALLNKLVSLSGGDEKHVDRDLKIAGLIVLFVAPGLALFAWLIGLDSPEAFLPLLGVAALAGCVSIGLLVASAAIARANREEAAAASDQHKA